MSQPPDVAEEIYRRISSLPCQEWQIAISRECAGRPELQARVEEMLAGHSPQNDAPAAGSKNFGCEINDEDKVAAAGYETTCTRQAFASEDQVICDRYTLEERIGEGGMGEVWVAKQTEPIRRRVALKLIKAGMDSKAMLARFSQERLALAMMDHPHIARILDSGLTAQGQPFFVMELVKGQPLTKFCDQMKLTLEERLALFVSICQAVQHAHQKGIVHRDLKPSNILVTLIDGCPVPKIIDFGVAKALSGTLTEGTLTQFGAVVGTLEYMSPEQASFAGNDIDTRSDIYSLGVILYELLTGLKPIDKVRLGQAAMNEVIRIICEEEPSKPSTRIATDEALPSLAAVRKVDPKRLMSSLRGELDWIVMKCLEKDRECRYETANGLLRDVERYLADEPVEARPQSARYKARKFLQRNKGPAIAASLLLISLLGGIAGTTWGLFEARRQTNLARQETEAKEAALFAETAAKQLAIEAKEKETVAKLEAERQSDIAQDAVDKYLNAVTDDPQLKNNNFFELRKKLLETAIPFYQQFTDLEASDSTERVAKGEALMRLASVQKQLGDVQNALISLNEAKMLFEELATHSPSDAKFRSRLASIHTSLGQASLYLGRRDEAIAHAMESVNLFSELSEADSTESNLTGLALGHKLHGRLLLENGAPEKGLEQMKKAKAIYRVLLSRDPDNAGLVQGMAEVLIGNGRAASRIGDWSAAIEENKEAMQLQKLLVDQHPEHMDYRSALAVTQGNVGVLLERQGRLEEALQMYDATLANRELVAERFPDAAGKVFTFASGHRNLGQLLPKLGRTQEAAQHLEEAISTYKSILEKYPQRPAYRKELGQCYRLLAQCATNLGDESRGTEMVEESFRVLTELANEFPADHQIVYEYISTLAVYADMLSRDGQRAKAVSLLQEALETSRDTFGEGHDATLSLLSGLATLYQETGQFERALSIRDEILALSPNDPDLHNQEAWHTVALPDQNGRYWGVDKAIHWARHALTLSPEDDGIENTLGVALYRNAQWQEAIDALQHSINHGSDVPHNWLFIAMSNWNLGQKVQAEQWYEKSLAWKEANEERSKRDPELEHFFAEAKSLMDHGTKTSKTEEPLCIGEVDPDTDSASGK